MTPHHQNNPAPDVPLVKASELAEYGFCRKSWWLRNVRQLTPDNQANLKRGQQAHTRNERRVESARRWRQASFVLFGIGLVILIAAVLAGLG